MIVFVVRRNSPFFILKGIPLIQLVNIEKSFGTKTLFSKVKYQFPNGERLALVGANGAGKTTLLNIITGLETADDGNVLVPQQVKIGYLPQTPNPTPEGTVLEEAKAGNKRVMELQKIMADLLEKVENDGHDDSLLERFEGAESEFRLSGGYSIESKAVSILKGLGFKETGLNLPPQTLSGGWRMRLELARLLIAEPDFLVLDEPTNHLDLPSLVWIESWLMGYRGTLLFVSHDRELLNRLPTMVLYLDAGKLTPYRGNFDQFLEQREAQMEQERAKSEQLKQRREAMEDFVKRFGAKASKAKQAQSRVKMIARIRDLEGDLDTDQANYSFSIDLPSPAKTPRLVMEVDGLSIGYSQPLAQGIECTVERGYKIAVIGANGIGKSTFLKTLAGLIPSLAGRMIPSPSLKIAYFSQDQSEILQGERTIIEQFVNQTGLGEKESRNLLGGFMFRGEDVFKKVTVLSGGELSRVGLACAVSKRSGLLLLDEPTNHLDMATVEGLITALDEYEGTMVFVSHDRTFIEGVCTHVFAMLPDGRSRLFPGKLADYETLASTSGFPNVLKVEAESQKSSHSANSKKADKQLVNLSHQEAKDLKSQKQKLEKKQSIIDQEMNKLKTRLKVLDDIMVTTAPDNHQAIREHHREQQELQERLDHHENQWIELGEEIDKFAERLGGQKI